MKTVISVKVDKDVRDKAQKVAKKLGLPLSLIVNTSLRQFAAEERLVVETPRVYKMTKKLERRLAPIEADIKAGRNLSPMLRTPEEVGAYLDGLK